MHQHHQMAKGADEADFHHFQKGFGPLKMFGDSNFDFETRI